MPSLPEYDRLSQFYWILDVSTLLFALLLLFALVEIYDYARSRIRRSAWVEIERENLRELETWGQGSQPDVLLPSRENHEIDKARGMSGRDLSGAEASESLT